MLATGFEHTFLQVSTDNLHVKLNFTFYLIDFKQLFLTTHYRGTVEFCKSIV